MVGAVASYGPCAVASVACAHHRARHQSALPPTAFAAAIAARVRRDARAKAGTPVANVAQVASSRGRSSQLGGVAIEVPRAQSQAVPSHTAWPLRPQRAMLLGGEPHMSTRLSPRSRPPAPADEDDADDADRGISARAPSYLGMETGVVWGDGASSPTSGGVVYVRSHALE